MFKDRRVLIEQEIVRQKQACGQLYKRMVTGQADLNEGKMYESMKATLSDMMSELMIIEQMIQDGHE
jgi:hypothetical protein